jgi:hypothetical protein
MLTKALNMVLAQLTPGNWIAILVPVGLTFLGALGTIIYRQGGLDKSVATVERKIDKIDEKFDKYLLRNLASSQSPLVLTPEGLKIFNREAIQQFIKDVMSLIIDRMKNTQHENAYRAQESLFTVVDSFKNSPYQTILENEAFQTGQHIDILMKLIAVGIRDQVFKEIGFTPDEIDKTDPSKKV